MSRNIIALKKLGKATGNILICIMISVLSVGMEDGYMIIFADRHSDCYRRQS